MKTWFPFTDYDFYAYLASGALLIAAADLAGNQSAILSRTDWSFVAIVVFFASAYVCGHLIASVSSHVLEHALARTALSPPAEMLLGYRTPTSFERFAARLIGRCYEPFPPAVLSKICSAAAAALGQPASTLSAEEIFQVAHRHALGVDHVRDRVADFRNQYGFCRNIALVGLIATMMFTAAAAMGRDDLWVWLAVSVFVVLGMTVRFLKFYAAFAAEVLRTLMK